MVERIQAKNGRKPRTFFKEWREHRLLTQEQLAGRLETTKATISRIESGKSQYNADYLQALADALSCEVPDFFRHPDEPTLDDLLRNQPAEKRRQAIAVVKTLLAS